MKNVASYQITLFQLLLFFGFLKNQVKMGHLELEQQCAPSGLYTQQGLNNKWVIFKVGAMET